MSETPGIDESEMLAKIKLALNPKLGNPKFVLGVIKALRNSPEAMRILEEQIQSDKNKRVNKSKTPKNP